MMSPNKYGAYSGQKRSKSKPKNGKTKGKSKSSRKGGQEIDGALQQLQSSADIDIEDLDVMSKEFIGKSSFKRAAQHKPNPS